MNSSCAHKDLHLLNPFETIRKYACKNCLEVMMCACDKEIGTKFLPHQLREGTELKTQERISVSLGFIEKVCDECRGLKPKAHPRASIPGQTSKIKRYYWREITFEEYRRFEKELGATDLESSYQHPERSRIEQEVLDHFKSLHAENPKYEYTEKSQSEVLSECETEIVNLSAQYTKNSSKGAIIHTPSGVVSVETFVTEHFQNHGLSVLELESRPFHVLFGALMGRVICDRKDKNCETVSFGSRKAFGDNITSYPIYEFMPSDFGTSGYASRRKLKIDQRIRELQSGCLDEQFALGVDDNASLLEYLWAHEKSDQDTAGRLLEILPSEIIISALEYLTQNYWGHYLGWPDLLVWSGSHWFFVEVKSSKDKLSEDQKRWITDNYETLKFPFKLVKVHRIT